MEATALTAGRAGPLGWVLAVSCLLAQPARAQALTLEQRVELPAVTGRIDHMDVDAEGGRLFVAALGADSLEVVDLKAGKRISRIAHLREPQGVSYWPESRRLFVANASGGGVQAFQDAREPARSGPAAELADADNLRFDARAKLLYAGYGSALAAIDPDTLRIKQRIELAGHPESFQLDSAGRFIYVNVPSAGHIAIVDRVAGKVTATWTLASAARNFPMALEESSQRLFVATRQPAVLLAYDLRSGREIDRLSICGDADDLFADLRQRRLYVVCGEGQIDVVHPADGGRLRVAERVTTAPGARTGLFDPDLGRLYVAVPARGGSVAEIRAYRTN
jgi:hypothetical protein